MWIALVIAILCIVMMFLLVLALYKTNMFQQEKDELNANIVEKAREIKELKEEVRELKNIRKALNHDNTLLLAVNEKQRKILTEVANISTTHLVDHEKEAVGKIKELTRDYLSNVSSN